MFTSQFWTAALERALKTVAQTLIAVLGVGVTGILDADWPAALSAAGLAGVLSLLTSVASAGVGDSSPSLTTVEQLDYRPKHDAD